MLIKLKNLLGNSLLYFQILQFRQWSDMKKINTEWIKIKNMY